MLLEGYLATFAVAQALVVTLRAGSRALHAIQEGSIGIIEGPLILPPGDIENEGSSYYLWHLTAAFRQGVKLGLRVEEYKDSSFYEVVSTIAEKEDADKGPYRMSLVPATKIEAKTEHEQPDDEVDGFSTENVDDLKHSRRTNFWRTRSKEEMHWDLDFTEALVTEYALDSDRIAHISSYAPKCFSALRSDFGIDEHSFRTALLDSGPFVSFQSNSKGAARSGGVFFFTRDGSYIVKTIKREEMRTLLQMLPKYAKFMKENGRRSLLTRFFGLYKVCLKAGDNNREACHYIVIMNSVFPAEASKLISERFDLKGSTVGREATIEERATKGSHAVLKDLDLSREVEHARLADELQSDKTPDVSLMGQNYGLRIGPDAKDALMKQLRMDVGLLEDCAVIDYSLLVGVVLPKDGNVVASSNYEPRVSWLERCRKNFIKTFLSVISVPFQATMAPSLFLFGKAGRVSAWPPLVPYFESDRCGVDAGQLSKLRGERKGAPALYYFGLIDFLQPFDRVGKILEYKLKALVYERDAYSCVPPGLYARRFLAFVDEHIS